MAQAPAPAKKQPAKAAAPGAQPSGDDSIRAYEAGIKAHQGGRYEEAVTVLGSAISAGTLPPQYMAKALYHRGLSYRKQGKPGLAISDLTSAIWLKGGLSDAEKADATNQRSAAYREAGLAEPPVALTSAGRLSKSAPAPAPASPPAKTVAAAAPAEASANPPSPPVAGWGAATKPVTRPAGATQAPAETGTAALPWAKPSAGTQTAAAASKPAPAAEAQSGSGIGSMFSSIFGGGTSKEPAQAVAAAAPTASPVADWSNATQVKPSRLTEKPEAGAKGAPAVPVTTAAVAPDSALPPVQYGRFRLQVGSAKSKTEAEKLAAKFKADNVRVVAKRQLEVEPASAEGTYRVNLGPFVSANEPRNLCVKLRQSGYDCMVTAVK